MQIGIWVILGAAIGIAANLSATRLRHRALMLDVASGGAAALATGASFTTLGAVSVHGISVFGADPVAFYGLLAAAGGALVFFIALDALTDAGTSAARRRALIDLAVEFSNVASRSRSLFRGVGAVVRTHHPTPALAKTRAR